MSAPDEPSTFMISEISEDGATLVSTEEFEDALRRVQNLATWYALGGTVTEEITSIWD